MSLKEVSYEAFLKKIDAIEKRCKTERGFAEGAREKGLSICEKLRREVEELDPENCTFFIDYNYGLPLYRQKEDK